MKDTDHSFQCASIRSKKDLSLWLVKKSVRSLDRMIRSFCRWDSSQAVPLTLKANSALGVRARPDTDRRWSRLANVAAGHYTEWANVNCFAHSELVGNTGRLLWN